MTKQALLWGAITGIASLLWLYIAYWIGLHTSGMGRFNIFMLGWLVLNIVCYTFALRSFRKSTPAEDWSFFRGFCNAAITAAIVAAFAIIAQIGYWKVIHPEWPEYLIEQTKIHFEKQDIEPSQIDQAMEQARKSLTLPRYAVQSAASHFLLGVMISAIGLVLMTRRR